jgi:hypothetical protein
MSAGRRGSALLVCEMLRVGCRFVEAEVVSTVLRREGPVVKGPSGGAVSRAS